MPALRSMALAAALAGLALPAAGATTTTFDFFWTGNPDLDSSLLSSSDPTAEAVGQFVVTAEAGAQVGPANVDSFWLSFGTATAGPATVTNITQSLFFFDGTISSDGRSIAMRDLYVEATYSADVARFGCLSQFGDCALTRDDVTGELADIIMDLVGLNLNFIYSTDEAVLASLMMTEVEDIPLPATLPLLLGALGLFAVLRRRAV